MAQPKLNAFGKLGRLITRRKASIIAVWIILLAIILPIVATATGVTSLQMGSSSESNVESVVASNIIKAQFQDTVANNSLVIVISCENASSISTQHFIDDLISQLKSNTSITGIENVTSVYTILVPALNATNEGVYLAYKGGNLTYTLLYSVPAIYSNVWWGAYNETKFGQLMPGLNETAQGVYAVLDNSNMTYNLLYSVPAIYLQAWTGAYASTSDVTMSNDIAYAQTDAVLQAADPTAYALYTSQLLYAFNASWTYSFLTNPTLTPDVRASLAANQTNAQYISTALAGNATMQAFVTALTQTFSLNDYLTNTQAQNNQKLADFAIQTVVNQSGSSGTFITAAYDLGRTPSDAALATLADKVIWYSQDYNLSKFVPLFNEISYNQTRDILKDADEESYINYTSHLLNYFNASWAQKVPTIPTQNWINQTAQDASNVANIQFIDNYLNESKDFSYSIAQTFTLQDFLDANTTDTNSRMKALTINYMVNETDLSKTLITAIYNLGENATATALENLASNIVWNPDAYNVGEQFNALITGLVSPNKDVTLVTITLSGSSDTNLLAIRGVVAAAVAQVHDGIHSAQITGSDALNYDFGKSTEKDIELILPITIVLLIVATGLFFRSIVTPLITLGTIGVALGISQIFPYLVSTYINPVDYTVTTVLLTIIIGVGTDYSIFILARHREERINDLPLHQAIIKSITWAGESIVTSGATVIISFLALATTSLVMLQTMGLIVGLGIIVTLLVSLTFAPALAAVLGDRIFWPNTGERFQRYAQRVLEKNKRRGGYFARSGMFAVKHGKALILIAVLVSVPLLYMYVSTTPTYDLLGSASNNLESIGASNRLTDSFGGGILMPTYVVVTFSHPIVDDNGNFNMGEMATLQSISSAIAGHAGIQEVTGPTMPFGDPVHYQTITNESDSATYTSMISTIGADNQSALITVKFSVDPYSTDAMNYAKDIRSSLHTNYDSAQNVTGVYMGGTTGDILDTRVSFESQFNTILPIVALGVGIVLFLVLGSLILPVFAIISVLMSIVWTLALTIVVFNAAFGYGLLFITPLILFVLLLGLGMDYNIFILTRIREEVAKGQSQNEAIVHAIQQTGGIITAAAVILAGSLGTLMLSSNMLLREMGFAFCFSILIDALVVRTYLVPAVMSTFGKWNWYNPIKRLRRVKDPDSEKPVQQA